VPRSETEAPNVSARVARLGDVPWLLDQLRAFDRFYGTRAPLFPEEEQARAFLANAIGDWDKFLFLIAEHELASVGFIAGWFYPHPYNPRIRVLGEVFWWVAPEYRGTMAAGRLLDRYVNEGRKRADWITITLEAKSPVDPRGLEKRGFRLHETTYLLEVEHGGA
jgi:RimJ/RimL family protein N-acetyltransferase